MIIYNNIMNKNNTSEEYANKQIITNTKRFFFKKGENGLSCYIKKGSNDTREPTHRLFDGGNLHIKKEDMDEFFKEYAVDLLSGKKNYITELRTPIFKYFMDLDIFDNEFYSDKKLKKIVLKIQSALSFFFERHNFVSDVYVCTTPPKNVKKNEEEYIKTGVHLIWPFVHVTQEIALFLRQFVIQYMEKKLGTRPEHNSWEDVIDETVYNQNGLRMVGSYKATICKICKNNELNKHGCNICFGIGRNIGLNTYDLEYIISTNKTERKKLLKTLKKKQTETIQCLSIRTYKLKSNINVEEPYPSWFDITLASKKDKKVVGEMLRKARYQKNANGKKTISVDDEHIMKLIETLIQSTFGTMKCYNNIGIKTVRKSDTTKKECYWVSTDSNFCQNVDREHSSAEIYFEIDYDTIVQRCYSSKKATHDRSEGLCKDFRSKKSFVVPLKMKKELFPKKYEEINNKHKSINGHTTDKEEVKNIIKSDIFEEFGFVFDPGN